MNFKTQNIRKLFLEGFPEQEFNDFCMDNFWLVHKEFTADQTRSRRINILIEYLLTNNEMVSCLEIIKADKPKKYDEYKPYTVERREKVNKFVPIHKKYTCNRYEHGKLFDEKFKTNKNAPIQFYIIHGEDKQSPEGLCIRFFYEFLQKTGNNSIYEKLKIEGYNIEDTKGKFIANLFRSFEADYNLPFNELSFDNLLKSKLIKDKKYVAIQIRIYSNLWDNHYSDFIKWFTEIYCNINNVPDNAPKILIFWTIIYKENTKNKRVFFPFYTNKTKKEIKKCFKSLAEENYFPELPPVAKDDIEVWLDNLNVNNYGTVKRLVSEHFADEKRYYDMWFVENGLGDIINKYNEGNLD